MKNHMTTDTLEPLIFTIRDQRVILDADLARIYGVETRTLNQAVKRNADRFPEDFAFQLTNTEYAALRSQFVISKTTAHDATAGRLAAPSPPAVSRGGRRYAPWVFTEHGALMAANALRSDLAVQMSVYVVRAFVRQRSLLAANAEILKRLAEIDKTLLEHDQALRVIWSRLMPLLAPPLEKPRRRIGFLAEEEK